MKNDSICVIPAKGQSQRIPRKNMALLAGKPLLQYTLEAALAGRVLDVIVVSTDDAEIAEFVRAHGVEAPFLRDKRLVSDNVTMADVVLDAVCWYEENRGQRFENLCMLLPSSPLRTAEDIVAAKRLLDEHPEADSILSVTRCPYPPGWALHVSDDGSVRPTWPDLLAKKRQDLPDWCYENGAVFWARMASFQRIRSQYGGLQLPYFMPADRGLDVDHPEELERAEWLMERGKSR